MDIDLWSVFLQVVNFLILVWILQRFLYKPMLAVIARRQEETDRAFTDAKSLKDEASNERHTYETRLAEIEAERTGLLREARAAVVEERQKMLETAQSEAAATLSETRRRTEEERKEVAATVSGSALSLAVDLTTKLLSETDGRTVTAALLRKACEQFSELPAYQRELLKSEVTGNDGMAVVLACKLDDEQKSECRGHIAERLGVDGALVRFETDPSLIAGVELRFSHTIVSFNWRDGLASAKEQLMQDARAG